MKKTSLQPSPAGDSSPSRQNLLNQETKRSQQSGLCGLSSSSSSGAAATKSSDSSGNNGSVVVCGKGGISFPPVVNLVFYVLCLTSLGASFYLNFRQTYLEERLRHFHHLDDRLSRVESKLQSFHSQSPGFHSHRRKHANFFSTTEKEFDDELLASGEDSFQDVASVVRKLSLEVEGIQRLRRDVSHLKLTRQQRQTAIQQSPDCSCPPGTG